MPRLLVLLLGLHAVCVVYAATYTHDGSTSTWAASSWTPTGPPGTGDDVIFPAGDYEVTVDAAIADMASITLSDEDTVLTFTNSVAVVIGTLDVTGGKVNIDSGASLTLAGAGQMLGPSELSNSGTLTIGATGSFNTTGSTNPIATDSDGNLDIHNGGFLYIGSTFEMEGSMDVAGTLAIKETSSEHGGTMLLNGNAAVVNVDADWLVKAFVTMNNAASVSGGNAVMILQDGGVFEHNDQTTVNVRDIIVRDQGFLRIVEQNSRPLWSPVRVENNGIFAIMNEAEVYLNYNVTVMDGGRVRCAGTANGERRFAGNSNVVISMTNGTSSLEVVLPDTSDRCDIAVALYFGPQSDATVTTGELILRRGRIMGELTVQQDGMLMLTSDQVNNPLVFEPTAVVLGPGVAEVGDFFSTNEPIALGGLWRINEVNIHTGVTDNEAFGESGLAPAGAPSVPLGQIHIGNDGHMHVYDGPIAASMTAGNITVRSGGQMTLHSDSGSPNDLSISQFALDTRPGGRIHWVGDQSRFSVNMCTINNHGLWNVSATDDGSETRGFLYDSSISTYFYNYGTIRSWSPDSIWGTNIGVTNYGIIDVYAGYSNDFKVGSLDSYGKLHIRPQDPQVSTYHTFSVGSGFSLYAGSVTRLHGVPCEDLDSCDPRNHLRLYVLSSAWLDGNATLTGCGTIDATLSVTGGKIAPGGSDNGDLASRTTCRMTFIPDLMISSGSEVLIDVEGIGKHSSILIEGMGSSSLEQTVIVRSRPSKYGTGAAAQQEIIPINSQSYVGTFDTTAVYHNDVNSTCNHGIDSSTTDNYQLTVVLGSAAGTQAAASIEEALGVLNGYPTYRFFTAYADDREGNVYVYGGSDVYGNMQSEMYKFNLTRVYTDEDMTASPLWEYQNQHFGPGLGQRGGAGMVWDAERNRLWIYGGALDQGLSSMPYESMFYYPDQELTEFFYDESPFAQNPGYGVTFPAVVMESPTTALVIGGLQPDMSPSDRVYRFLLANAPTLSGMSWDTSSVPPMPLGLFQHSAVRAPDAIYVFGGTVTSFSSSNRLKNNDIFRFAAGSWITVLPANPHASRPLGRSRFGFAMHPTQNALVVRGGMTEGDASVVVDTWIYDLDTNAWSVPTCPADTLPEPLTWSGMLFYQSSWFAVTDQAIGYNPLPQIMMISFSCGAGLASDSDDGFGSCTTCAPGYSSPDGVPSCIPCPRGTYTDTHGAKECLECGVGNYTVAAGSTECSECPQGYYCPGNGVGTPCDPGEYGTATGAVDDSVCAPCPAGSASSDGGMAACPPCPVGTATMLTGQNQCQLCNSGEQQPNTGQTTCEPCPVGTASWDYGEETCDLCPVGTAVAVTGQTSCPACGNGQFQDLTGQTQCQQCPPGKHGPAWRASTDQCYDCDPGTYTNTFGNEQCSPCWPGSYSDQPGTVECTQCPIEGYQDVTGSTKCQLCPDNTVARVKGASFIEECQCKEGFFTRDERTGVACEPCPDGATCEGILAAPVAQAGYWQSSDDPFTIYECIDPLACPGGGEDAGCSEGYTGRMCGLCEDGFFRFGRVCTACPEAAGGFIVVYMLMAFGVVALFLFLASAGYDWGSLALAINFVQLVGVLHKFPLQWDGTLSVMFAVLSFTNLNIDMTVPECQGWETKTTYWHKFNFILTLPLTFLGLFLVAYTIYAVLCVMRIAGRKKPKNADPSLAWNPYRHGAEIFMQAYFSFMSFFYIGLVSTALSVWECAGQPNGTQTFIPDPSMDCWSPEHNRFVPGGIMGILVYAIGMPLVGMWYLRRNKFNLNLPFMKNRMGYLYERYTRKYYYWEVVQTARKFWFLLCPVMVPAPLFTVVFGMMVGQFFLLLVTHVKPNLWKVHDRVEVYLLGSFMFVLFGGMTAFIAEGDVRLTAVVLTGIVTMLSVLIVSLAAVYDVYVQTFHPEKLQQPGIDMIDEDNPLSPLSPARAGLVDNDTVKDPKSPGGSSRGSTSRRLSLTNTPLTEQIELLKFYVSAGPEVLVKISSADKRRFVREIEGILGRDKSSSGSRRRTLSLGRHAGGAAAAQVNVSVDSSDAKNKSKDD